jgi:AcrR family transcriptional regulator
MEEKSKRDPAVTRKQLKIAAKHEFNSVGYFATDTNKIARLAGYAPGSLYRHFDDKIDLFIEIYRDWHLEQMQEIQKTLTTRGSIEELAKKLTKIIIAFYGNWRVLRAAARVLVLSEPRVADFKVNRRIELVQSVHTLRAQLALSELPEEEIILFLILIERLGDAVAEGEFSGPSLPASAGHDVLLNLIERFLKGEKLV